MTVWIVLYSSTYSHDGVYVEGVFDSMDKADKFVDNHDKPGNCSITFEEVL